MVAKVRGCSHKITVNYATPELIIVRGNTFRLPLDVTLPVYRYEIPLISVVVIPAVGSIYRKLDRIYTVAAVTGATISVVSDQNSDNLSTVGTLDKVSGTGDVVISYLTRTSTKTADITGMTFNLRVITQIADNPSAGQIVLPTKAFTIHLAPKIGKTTIELTASETLSLPIGSYYGVLEAVNPSSEKSEQTNQQTFTVTVQENKIA